jgi:hypothetical protein
MKMIKNCVCLVFLFCFGFLTIPTAARADEIDVPKVRPKSMVDAPYAFSANNNMAIPICFKDNKPTASVDCQTVELQNLTYWPMSYMDNRLEFLLVGVTRQNYGVGKPKLVRVCGIRYYWKAEVDNSKRQIRFFGQGDSTVTVPWSLLFDDGKDGGNCGI